MKKIRFYNKKLFWKKKFSSLNNKLKDLIIKIKT